jgi:hypothetical protein
LALVNALLFVGFAVSLVGCASLGPVKPVAVSDIKSVAGQWSGKMYGLRADATPHEVELTIREDGTYHLELHETIAAAGHGRGKIVIREGRLIMQGEGDSSHGVGTLHMGSDGRRALSIEATLSDNSLVSAQLTPRR